MMISYTNSCTYNKDNSIDKPFDGLKGEHNSSLTIRRCDRIKIATKNIDITEFEVRNKDIIIDNINDNNNNTSNNNNNNNDNKITDRKIDSNNDNNINDIKNGNTNNNININKNNNSKNSNNVDANSDFEAFCGYQDSETFGHPLKPQSLSNNSIVNSNNLTEVHQQSPSNLSQEREGGNTKSSFSSDENVRPVIILNSSGGVDESINCSNNFSHQNLFIKQSSEQTTNQEVSETLSAQVFDASLKFRLERLQRNQCTDLSSSYPLDFNNNNNQKYPDLGGSARASPVLKSPNRLKDIREGYRNSDSSAGVRLNHENIQRWLVEHGINSKLRSFSTANFQLDQSCSFKSDTLRSNSHNGFLNDIRNSLLHTPKQTIKLDLCSELPEKQPISDKEKPRFGQLGFSGNLVKKTLPKLHSISPKVLTPSKISEASMETNDSTPPQDLCGVNVTNCVDGDCKDKTSTVERHVDFITNDNNNDIEGGNHEV